MSKKFQLLGSPSSAGAFAPGQEKAPKMLREAGLLKQMNNVGFTVRDRGDLPGFRYKSDPENPYARNIDFVSENAKRVANNVEDILAMGDNYLVLGGDCTVGAGAIAGATRDKNIKTGVIYFDMHGDLNTPETVKAGALDWMGMAHLLDVTGAHPKFVKFDHRAPVLSNDQFVLLGWDYVGANSDAERELIIRRRFNVVPLEEIKKNAESAANQALSLLNDYERIVVHFDVDVVDFADCPLGENYRHGEGCTFDQAMVVLATLAYNPRFSGVTISELNPDHGEEDLSTLKRFCEHFSKALGSCV